MSSTRQRRSRSHRSCLPMPWGRWSRDISRSKKQMASMTRRLNLLLLGAIAAAISACANPQVQECGATGVFCPSGTHCAAAQGICLPDTNTCGDAHMDPGEVCDDGNTNDGDGCSRDCTSDETCGNS